MACHGIEHAYQHNDVNIGWRLGRALKRTSIRTLPGAGTVVSALSEGKQCGLQTVRNPRHVTHPDPRSVEHDAAGRPWVWAYARKSCKTGWVCLDDIAQLPPGPPDQPLKGPHRLDFEVGNGMPRDKHGPGCGKASKRKPVKTVSRPYTYLRYSPHGTAFHYLHHGDKVRVLLIHDRQGCEFVEVVHIARGGTARAGSTSGWMITQLAH
ncbi:MAG TPA: hypothetical protein VFY45_23680 [Baekduia sp.]|nr:hypothetical protein [Baekduia sp.]